MRWVAFVLVALALVLMLSEIDCDPVGKTLLWGGPPQPPMNPRDPRTRPRPRPAPKVRAVAAPASVRVAGYLSPVPAKAPRKLVFRAPHPEGTIEYFFAGPFARSQDNRVLTFAGSAQVRVIPSPRPPVTPVQSEASRALLEAANAARADAGVGPLLPDPRLDRAAQDWATYCARIGVLDHFGPKGTSNEDPWTRMIAAGYPATYERESENAAYGQMDSDQAIEGWLQSPGHRMNLLNPAWDLAGGGMATGLPDGRPYWIQVYANP